MINISVYFKQQYKMSNNSNIYKNSASPEVFKLLNAINNQGRLNNPLDKIYYNNNLSADHYNRHLENQPKVELNKNLKLWET